MSRILIRGARQLLTLLGPIGPRRGDDLRELGVIADGSLLIANGVITNAGPTRRIENLAESRSAEEINAAGRIVMPGFVDSHTHLISAPARVASHALNDFGSGDEHSAVAALLGTSLHYVRNTSASKIQFNARRALEGLVRHGTTAVEAKSGYGLNEAGELKSLKVLSNLRTSGVELATTFLGAHATPPEFAGRPNEYLQWLCEELVPKIGTRRLAQFADAFCGRSGFTPEQVRPYLECAQRHQMIARLHADQSVRSGGVALAVALDAASVDGLNFSNAADAELLARSRTIATLLPGNVAQHSDYRYPPARTLIDSGAAVALATGFHPSTTSTFNMQTVLSLARRHMNMSPEEVISAATINGAHALRRANQIGSLQFGKDADLIMMDVPDYREIAYHFGVNLVAMTMCKGKVVYREGVVQCGEPS